MRQPISGRWEISRPEAGAKRGAADMRAALSEVAWLRSAGPNAVAAKARACALFLYAPERVLRPIDQWMGLDVAGTAPWFQDVGIDSRARPNFKGISGRNVDEVAYEQRSSCATVTSPDKASTQEPWQTGRACIPGAGSANVAMLGRACRWPCRWLAGVLVLPGVVTWQYPRLRRV